MRINLTLKDKPGKLNRVTYEGQLKIDGKAIQFVSAKSIEQAVDQMVVAFHNHKEK